MKRKQFKELRKIGKTIMGKKIRFKTPKKPRGKPKINEKSFNQMLSEQFPINKQVKLKPVMIMR